MASLSLDLPATSFTAEFVAVLTPRSKTAAHQLGILLDELIYRDPTFFRNDDSLAEVQQLRYEEYEKTRLSKLNKKKKISIQYFDPVVSLITHPSNSSIQLCDLLCIYVYIYFDRALC